MQGGLKEAPQSWGKSWVLVQVPQEHREKPWEDPEHQPPLVNIVQARESRGCHRGIRAAPPSPPQAWGGGEGTAELSQA